MLVRKSFGVALLAVVGCGTGAAAEKVRPADPTAAGALGEAECHEVSEGAEPLVVDWKPEQRGDLELAMKDGLAVVSYSCTGIKVLADCHIEGDYAFSGMTRKEQLVRLENADEVRANLPLSGATIGGELARGSTIDVAMVMVGKRRTAWREPTKADLKGQCDGATHFVRSATVGAFAMETGTKAKARVAAEVLGAGASGQSSSEKSTANRDGDPKACSNATPAAETPPDQCGAAIRLVLAPIKPAAEKPVEAPVVPPAVEAQNLCPQGLVASDGKCTKREQAASYQCKTDDTAECKTQCDKGHAGSCAALGRAYLAGAGVDRDEGKARELFQRACEKGDAGACDGLGNSIAASDPAKATEAWTKACDGGTPAGCTHLGRSKLASDAAAALALLERGCDGADPEGCALAAEQLAKGTSSEDRQRAFRFDSRACQGGVLKSCVLVGRAYEGSSRLVGRSPALAQMYFRRACYRGDASGCFELGRSLYGSNPDEAKRHFQFACMRNVTPGCAALAVLFDEKRAVIATPAVRGPLEKACMSGSALDCTVLGMLDLASHNKTTRVQLQRACTQGQKLACTLFEKSK